MNENDLERKKKNYIGILTNTQISTLRNKIIYSLGGSDNSYSTKMTDLFIYLLHKDKQQRDDHRTLMIEHDGYFLLNCNQIEHDNFLSEHHRRETMNGLKELGVIDFKEVGRVKTYRIKVFIEKMVELVENNEDNFNRYLDDFRETEMKKSEERKNRQIETKEKWKTINEWKYKDLNTFKDKMFEYGYNELDTKLISFISKGLWKHKHKVIEWTEQDLNYVRSLVCEGNRYTVGEDGNGYFKTKKEQEELFNTLGGNYQRIVDTCKMDDKKFKGMKSWSVVYGYQYKENNYDEDGKPYRYNYNWKMDDLDYYESDITFELLNY